jgi:hypothetical protein
VAAGGRRRARQPSLRAVAARAWLVLLFAGLSAGGALFGAPLLAVLAGFVAIALLIDRIFPISGFLRIDAQHEFQRLVWQRRRESLGRRNQCRLELLPAQLYDKANRRHLGVQPIPLDSIIGTVEPHKALEFDHTFRPPRWSRGRWELMWMARRRGDSLPPISVYRLHGRHFVIDGHHRISVERSLGAASIDAHVVELLPLSGRGALPSASSTTRRTMRGPLGFAALSLYLAVGLGLALLSGAFGSLAGYLLIIAACAFIGRGLGSPLHAGLQDYRQ